MRKQERRLSTPAGILIVVVVLLSFPVVFWVSGYCHLPLPKQLKLLAVWSVVPLAVAACFGMARDWNAWKEKQ